MKIWNVIKEIKFKKIFKDVSSEYTLFHNGNVLEKFSAKTFAAHHDTYKILRSLKTPSYNKCYFFRKKKAFNTLFFQQNYDVVITDKNGIIIEKIINIQRGKISQYYSDAFNILFFTVGTVNHHKFNLKDSLVFHHNFIKILKQL